MKRLTGGGELGALIRAMKWDDTPLGPLDSWPPSLKTALSLILNSRHPMWLGWGSEITFLYNDAYIPVLGAAKHPRALGRPASEVWSEIWDVCGPLADKVFRLGEASFLEDVRLFMRRGDRLEETFYSFSYSPIFDPDGGVAGLFCPSAETTDKVLNARRLRTLSELSGRALLQKSLKAAYATALLTLERNPIDIPFATLYSMRADGRSLELEGTSGFAPDDETVARRIDLSAAEHALIAGVVASATARLMRVDELGYGARIGPAGQRVEHAIVLPLVPSSLEPPIGLLVAGINPTREMDLEYRTFYDLLAAQITSAAQSATAVEEAKRRAEALAEIDRAKTAFFSNVSHEFRTPLTLLIGHTEDALASPERSLEGAALEAVYRNELRLMKLVNALLDFARIEAGKARALFEPVDLSRITRETAAVFQSAVERAGLAFVVACDPLPEPVFVDRDMWEKIVLNLVSNALKFTFSGQITVAMRRSPRDEREVELDVTDTGIGIPDEELPRLFDRFHRIEGARSRTYEGSGIGLALVHDLVLLHGGRIVVKSAPGKGTTFTVRLRLGSAHLPADQVHATPTERAVGRAAGMFVSEASRWLSEAEERERQSPPPSRSTERVLVVDDNADMRDYVQNILATAWDVEVAADGEQALARLRERRFDIVVTDVMMPNLDGFGLLGAIRADVGLARVPVIMVSARAGDEASVDGLQAGADDYLVKPFSARELVARVRTRLEISRARADAERARARLYDQFMQAPVPVSIVVGKDLVFELANPEYVTMVGGRDLVGKTFLEAFPEVPPGAPLHAMLLRVLETRERFSADEFHVRLDRDGRGPRDAYFQFTCQPMKRADGTVEGIMTAAIDVTEQVESRRLLDLERRRLTAIIEHLPVGLSLTERDGSTRTNPALDTLWARPIGPRVRTESYRDFVAYHPDGRRYGPEDWPNVRVLSTGEPLHIDALRFQRFDGREGFMRIDAVPLRDEKNDVVEALVAAVDVTTQKQAEELLSASRAEAERANRAKDEFLAMLGHELRNPLSPIVTALQLLEMKGRTERELAVISRQVRHLTRLVDDLLDVSRITRGKVELKKQRLELATVVVRAMEMSLPLLDQRRQEVDLDVPAEGLLIEGDPDRLAQVVSNLLTNASKYSEPGTVVRVRGERFDGAWARLRVIDHGIGISDDMLESVFDLFFQQPQALDRAKGGLGLGLAIVRSLVQMHGGRVVARSDGSGRGSEFIVDLPLDRTLSRREEGGGDGRAPVVGANKRVLVVDDNVDSAAMMAEFLTTLGYQVKIVNDAPSALAVVSSFAPRACLLDIGLPEMNGYELASALREKERGAGWLPMKLIAVTGYGQESDRKMALAAGFDAHVVKPVDLALLTSVLGGSD